MFVKQPKIFCVRYNIIVSGRAMRMRILIYKFKTKLKRDAFNAGDLGLKAVMIDNAF